MVAPAAQDASQTPPAQASPTPGASAAATSRSKGAQIEVPSGTHLPLVLHNAISTRSARPGDPVYFETLFPVMVNGKVVIPAGSYVSGEVTESKRPGRVKGRGELMIKLKTLILPNGYMVNLAAAPSSAGTGGGETVNKEGQVVGDTDKASDVGTVVKSTGAGAGIGAIAAGGKGAGIGAGIGAAAGLGAVLLARGPEAELPRGTTLEAVLDRPIFLDADKVQFTSPGQASTLSGPPNREPQRSKLPF
jgi:type IV secretion system protein VirB10